MNNQCVLVTAGAARIGREIALAFAANGAKVFVCDLDVKMLEALAQEIKGLVTHRFAAHRQRRAAGVLTNTKRNTNSKTTNDTL